MTIDLSRFDWNAVGALLTLVALFYAWRQVHQWKVTRAEQAAAVAPALLAEFIACQAHFLVQAKALSEAAEKDAIGHIPSRAQSFKATSVQVMERFIDKFDVFGRKDGSDLAMTAASVLAANAALDGLSQAKSVDGILEPIKDRALDVADKMQTAAIGCDIAIRVLGRITGIRL